MGVWDLPLSSTLCSLLEGSYSNIETTWSLIWGLCFTSVFSCGVRPFITTLLTQEVILCYLISLRNSLSHEQWFSVPVTQKGLQEVCHEKPFHWKLTVLVLKQSVSKWKWIWFLLFVFRTKQLWEEGGDSSGWISARTGFHRSQRDDVGIQILPRRRTVRAGHRSAPRPQDRHPGGVRGHTVTGLTECFLVCRAVCVHLNIKRT